MKARTLLVALLTGTLCYLTVAIARAQVGGSSPPSTRDVIQHKIQTEVAARFAETGAACDELSVTVAEDRDSATPFKVTYRGLRNFRGSNGALVAPDGEFTMNYMGGGLWQGALAGTKLTATVGTKDKIDLPFVNDPQALGEWESVDFVQDIALFTPGKRAWEGKLFLKGLTFQENGKMPQPWWTWTKGFVMHRGDQTASRYEIRTLDGTPYLFFEWKSGDVTIAGRKPFYYVLKLKAPKAV